MEAIGFPPKGSPLRLLSQSKVVGQFNVLIRRPYVLHARFHFASNKKRTWQPVSSILRLPVLNRAYQKLKYGRSGEASHQVALIQEQDQKY